MSYLSKFPKFSGFSVLAAGVAKFFNTANNHSISIQAPGALAVDKTYTLPMVDGLSNQFLKTDGTGNLAWALPVNSGEINYVTESNFEDGAVTGWTSYADAAGVVPVDATGGSPTCTFAINSTTPLDGVYDAKFSKDAANRQGEGVAYALKIPPAYRNTMSKISIAYRTTAGYDAATEGVSVFMYNVDSGVVIYPVGYNAATPPRLPHCLSGGTIGFQFLPTNTTDDDYRLVLHCGLTGTAAFDLFVDDVVVGPGQLIQGFGPDKQYVAGNTYNGVALTVTGGSNWTTTRGVFVPYKTADGAYRLRFNIRGLVDSGTRSSFGLTVSGIVAKNTANFYQLFTGDCEGVTPTTTAYTTPNAATLSIYHSSATTTAYLASGDIELDSWPTWADAPQPLYIASGADNSVSALNWTSYTPTGSWTTNTTYTGKWKRNADNVDFDITVSLSGAPNSASLDSIALPSGMTIDTEKMSESAPDVLSYGFGSVDIWDDASNDYYYGYVGWQDSTHVRPATLADRTAAVGAAGLSYNAPITFASGDRVRLRFSVPIVGLTAQDYLGKMLTGFATAKVGSSGIVNNDSSNTGGTPIKGATDGSAASAGYVGEQITGVQVIAANVPGANGNWGDLASIQLTPGTWDISAIACFNLNGSTTTAIDTGISTNAGNNGAGMVYGDNLVEGPPPTAAYVVTQQISQYRVTVTTVPYTTYYHKVAVNYSAGNPQYRSRISAVRIR